MLCQLFLGRALRAGNEAVTKLSSVDGTAGKRSRMTVHHSSSRLGQRRKFSPIHNLHQFSLSKVAESQLRGSGCVSHLKLWERPKHGTQGVH
jgi:hypothetical protein